MQAWLEVRPDEQGNCSPSFLSIATRLMNDYKLQVNEKFYRITECEFYFNGNGHADPYAHGHERQKSSIGEWYFHGSGLDITLAQESGYGGILIRSMVEVITGIKIPRKEDVVKGPLNICTSIFREFGAVTNKLQQFGLVDISRDYLGANMITARVFAVPRIGLNETKDAAVASYVKRSYRYLTFLHLPHTGSDQVKRFLLQEGPSQLTAEEYREFQKGTRCY